MLPARRAFGVCALLLLVVALAGCFRSDKPLIDKASAKFPFDEATLKTEEGETAVLKKQGDAYVYLDLEKPEGKQSDNRPILLHEVAEHLYVVQETGENGGSVYMIAKRDGDKVLVAAVCRALDQGLIERLGMERDLIAGDFSDCVVKDLNSLTELSQIPEIWSTETKTLQIISIK